MSIIDFRVFTEGISHFILSIVKHYYYSGKDDAVNVRERREGI